MIVVYVLAYLFAAQEFYRYCRRGVRLGVPQRVYPAGFSAVASLLLPLTLVYCLWLAIWHRWSKHRASAVTKEAASG